MFEAIKPERVWKVIGGWVFKRFTSPGQSRSCAAFCRLTLGPAMALSVPSDPAEQGEQETPSPRDGP